MCFFYSKLWTFRKKKNPQKKSTKKKRHIILSWALCPTCLPFLPLSTLLNWQKPDSGQLACVGKPKFTLLFWSHWWDWEKSCPLLLFHSWNAPVLPCASRAGSATTWDAWASPSALCSAWLQVQSSSWPSILQVEPSSPLPVGVVKALLSWAVTLFSSNCKRTQPSAAWWDSLPLPQHTHAGWPLLPCDSALFSRSRCRCV